MHGCPKDQRRGRCLIVADGICAYIRGDILHIFTGFLISIPLFLSQTVCSYLRNHKFNMATDLSKYPPYPIDMRIIQQSINIVKKIKVAINFSSSSIIG
jgi:hypothetical protein